MCTLYNDGHYYLYFTTKGEFREYTKNKITVWSTLFVHCNGKSFCGENRLLIANNNEDENKISGLTLCWIDGKERTFTYRSDDDYNKNSCTRPLKKIVDFFFLQEP